MTAGVNFDPVTRWLAQRPAWVPDRLPQTVAEAERRFRCDRVACTLTGRDCADAWVRGRQDEGTTRPATPCTGCDAGRRRSELLQISETAAQERSRLAREQKKKRRRLAPDFHGLLGRVPDAVVAARAGVDLGDVAHSRLQLGVEAYSGPKARPHGARFVSPVEWSRQRLGDVPDIEIAERLWLASRTVYLARIERGIPAPPRRAPRRFEPAWDALPLGTEPDRVLARRLGVCRKRVARARAERGIAPWRKPPLFNWDEQPLGRVLDGVLAEQLGVCERTVADARRERGIAPASSVCPLAELEQYGHAGRRALAEARRNSRPESEARRFLHAFRGTHWTLDDVVERLGRVWDCRSLAPLAEGRYVRERALVYLMKVLVWQGRIEQHGRGYRLHGTPYLQIAASMNTPPSAIWDATPIRPMTTKVIELLTGWRRDQAGYWLRVHTDAGRLVQHGRRGGARYTLAEGADR